MSIKRINCGTGHRYTIDGAHAISVTTALNVISKNLEGAAAMCVARRVVEMDNESWSDLFARGTKTAMHDLARTHEVEWGDKAKRGTDVHKLAEQVIHGVEVAVPDHLYGHVESTVAFLDDWQVRPVIVEGVVGDYASLYAGTFDLVADLPDGRRVLFDYKTGKRVYPETAMQLAAYRWASHYVCADGTELPMAEVGIDECMAVHVRSDGYDVYPLRADGQVYGAFLQAVHLARALKTKDSWVGAALQPTDINPMTREGVTA